MIAISQMASDYIDLLTVLLTIIQSSTNVSLISLVLRDVLHLSL